MIANGIILGRRNLEPNSLVNSLLRGFIAQGENGVFLDELQC